MYKIISDGLRTRVFHKDVELTGILSLDIRATCEGVTAIIGILLPTLEIEIEDKNVQIS